MNSRRGPVAVVRLSGVNDIELALGYCLEYEPWFVSLSSTRYTMSNGIGPLAVERAIEEARDD